jgi:hypothetical protein
LKALATNRPGFPVTIDDEIGKAGAVARVKEPGGRATLSRTSVLLTVLDRRSFDL